MIYLFILEKDAKIVKIDIIFHIVKRNYLSILFWRFLLNYKKIYKLFASH